MVALRPSLSMASLVAVFDASRCQDVNTWLGAVTQRVMCRSTSDMRIYLNKQNIGTGFCKANSYCLAYAARASRHQGRVAFERENIGCHVLVELWSSDTSSALDPEIYTFPSW